MHCHPPSVRRLQLVGNIHPVIIFFDPVDRAQAAAALAAHPNTAKLDVDKELTKAATLKLQYKHVFTHTVPLGADVQAAIAEASAVIAKEYKGDFWAVVPKALPRTVRG